MLLCPLLICSNYLTLFKLACTWREIERERKIERDRGGDGEREIEGEMEKERD